MVGIVIILVLSASMSTLSSLVLTSGSTLTLDIIVPAARKVKGSKAMSEKCQLSWIRILVIFFIAISSVIAIVQARSSVTFIAQLMGISWGALAGAFLAPFLYGLFWKKVSVPAVWASFISGVIILCACMFCNFTGITFISPFFSSPINAGVLAMVFGLVIVPVISAFTKTKNMTEVEEMFHCYDRVVMVKASDALNEEEK